MKLKTLLALAVAAFLIYILSVIGSGCAQIGAPTGGPRDSLPPNLLDASPPNRTTNFKGDRITLTFDEYILLQDLQKNLLVSPIPKVVPNINWKLREVSIKIRDTLQPNTTYSIDLGNTIQDINENNSFRKFTYVFSTGPYIDSLEFSGNIKLAETGKSDSTLIALLYNDLDDSAILKNKPRYITRLDSSGNFTFRNLSGGTYHVFGLKDESGQRYYNSKTELFAFADSVVVIDGNTPPLSLFAYAEDKAAQKGAAATSSKPEKTLKYTSSVSSGLQDLLTPLTITSNNKLKDFDSTKIKLADTLFNVYNNVSVSIDTLYKNISLTTPWKENETYLLIIPPDVAKDSLDNQLSSGDTLRFKTKKEGDYGSIKINFTNLEKFKNPVLQFVSNNVVVNSARLNGTQWSVALFNPGDYELRILEDQNENIRWDPGSYELKKQPEKVFSLPQRINIRANWENEKDFVL
ncbi:MAG: Ig-like domain-containing protein [Ginsengibacter sp.]